MPSKGASRGAGLKRKNYRLPQAKLDAARRVLGTRTETETIERALDLVAFGERLAAGTQRARGRPWRDPFAETDGSRSTEPQLPQFVVDTSLYLAAITTDEGNAALAAFQRRFAPFLVQHSAIAQEILVGARDESDYREYHEAWVAPFEHLGRIITPSHGAWLRAARIVARLVELGVLSRGGFQRSFLNDCLIAASAREHGFVLVTENTSDFARIRQVEPRLRFTEPWPER